MEQYGGVSDHQSAGSRSYQSMTNQSDVRSNPWLISRPMPRSFDIPLQAGTQFSSQSWSDVTLPKLPFNNGPQTFYNPWQPRTLGESASQASTLAPIPYMDNNAISGPSNSGNPSLLPTSSSASKRGRRKNNYSEDQWKQHIPQIKQLYLDEKRTLPDTMKVMAAQHNFTPSERVYKQKFEELGWQKKLSSITAQFIVNKHRERLEATGKPTDFVLFDESIPVERAEDTVRRSKKTGNLPDSASSLPPIGLVWSTPEGYSFDTPMPDRPNAHNRTSWTPLSNPRTPFPNYLPLVWNGSRVDDIAAIVDEGKAHEESGEMYNAEKKYCEALAAYEHLLSPTHQETLDVGYKIANLFAKQGFAFLTDQVLDRMNRKVVSQWGLSHKRSNEHFLRVVDLYRRWSRNDDAATLSKRLVEALDQSISNVSGGLTGLHEELPSIGDVLRSGRQTLMDGEGSDAIELSRALGFDLGQITHDATSSKPNKDVVMNLIRACQRDLPERKLEFIKATELLVKVADCTIDEEESAEVLREVLKASILALECAEEEGDDILEHAMHIAGSLVEMGDQASFRCSKRLLDYIVHHAERLYQEGSKEVAVICIRIGSIYEQNEMWSEARPWLEMALSASMSLEECNHRMVLLLEKALEEQRLGALLDKMRKPKRWLELNFH